MLGVAFGLYFVISFGLAFLIGRAVAIADNKERIFPYDDAM